MSLKCAATEVHIVDGEYIWLYVLGICVCFLKVIEIGKYSECSAAIAEVVSVEAATRDQNAGK
jgi:hypothetical protein